MIESLTALDFLVAALVLLMALAGLARGFVGEVSSLLAWVAGVLAVRFFHADAKVLLAGPVGSEAGAAALALIGLFTLAFVAVRLIGGALSKRTRASVVGPVDRVLGLGLGAAKGVIAATLAFLLISMGFETLLPASPQPRWLSEAKSAPALAIVSRALVDFVDEARRLDDGVAEAGPSGANPHEGLALPPPGYLSEERKALDRLLDEQEKSIPSTEI